MFRRLSVVPRPGIRISPRFVYGVTGAHHKGSSLSHQDLLLHNRRLMTITNNDDQHEAAIDEVNKARRAAQPAFLLRGVLLEITAVNLANELAENTEKATSTSHQVLEHVLASPQNQRWFSGSPVAALFAVTGCSLFFITYSYNIGKPVYDAYQKQTKDDEEGDKDESGDE